MIVFSLSIFVTSFSDNRKPGSLCIIWHMHLLNQSVICNKYTISTAISLPAWMPFHSIWALIPYSGLTHMPGHTFHLTWTDAGLLLHTVTLNLLGLLYIMPTYFFRRGGSRLPPCINAYLALSYLMSLKINWERKGKEEKGSGLLTHLFASILLKTYCK